MSRSALLAPLLLAIMPFDPACLAGQAIPRTEVFEIEPPAASGAVEGLGAVAVPGGFLVYWSSDSIHGRLIDGNGRLKARLEPDSIAGGPLRAVSAVRESSGEILWAWSAAASSKANYQAWMQRFTPSGEPEAACQKLSEWRVNTESVVTAAGGRTPVVAWLESSHDGQRSLKAGIVGPGRESSFDGILVDSSTGLLSELAAGVDAGGRFVIVWGMRTEDNSCKLVGQRFAPDGTRLGERFTVSNTGLWIKPCPYQRLNLAMMPDGSFAVAWRDWRGGSSVLRFRPDGTREGQGASFAVPSTSLAGDRYGNLAWMLPGIQLFNRYIVSQGVVWPDFPTYGETVVALGNRLLAVSAQPFELGETRLSVLGQIWDLRRDADACAYRDGRFLCDTAGNGGEPDVSISFGSGLSDEQPLMGDFDGDGRNDPCFYRDSRFACDTAHDGGTAEKQSPAFGQSGDVPLLGDLDGDGRDDPCVRRGKSFLCDADRNGKTDRWITFGLPGDAVAIGDVDGDGRDDPCVVRRGAFLCDSAHNGGAAETQLRLSAALAGLPPGTPALGDIDGDGREDPCMFVDGRLLCGLFPKGAKLPASIVDRPFGEPGDVLLLGDLDAF